MPIVQDRGSEDPKITATETEARQARPGWPVLYVLIAGIILAALVMMYAWSRSTVTPISPPPATTAPAPATTAPPATTPPASVTPPPATAPKPPANPAQPEGPAETGPVPPAPPTPNAPPR